MKKMFMTLCITLVLVFIVGCRIQSTTVDKVMEQTEDDIEVKVVDETANNSVANTEENKEVDLEDRTEAEIKNYNEIAKQKPQQKLSVYPEPLMYNREKPQDINYVYNKDRNRYDFRGYDITELDLTNTELANFIFDSQTTWTKKLPKGFDIDKIIEYGKKPGLNIETLHSKNITGNGVNVGIIDGRLLVDHEEFKDNIIVYEEIFEMDGPAHYHGTPITSILAGKNVGIAPDANIYYIAYLDEKTDPEDGFKNLANAIERMIEINNELPEDNKIKVVSISSGWNPESENGKAIDLAIKKAKEEGLFIITARLYETYNLSFDGLNREPMLDPNDINSYDLNFMLDSNSSKEGTLMVPMDARWLASATNQNEYVMYSKGAWSMAIPYISGLYTLACQVNPDITPDEFFSIGLSTGEPLSLKSSIDTKGKVLIIVNPIELISKIQ